MVNFSFRQTFLSPLPSKRLVIACAPSRARLGAMLSELPCSGVLAAQCSPDVHTQTGTSVPIQWWLPQHTPRM